MSEAPTRNELLDMVEYQKGVIADMAGHNDPNIPGFSPSESRILRCLQSANGRVVSDDGLMSAIYFDRRSEPGSAIIKVHISHIKTKLRRPACAVCGSARRCWAGGCRSARGRARAPWSS